MTTLYKLSIHSQSLEMRGIFLVSRYVGTINQLSVRQKFFCWFSLVFQKESAIQLSKPILQHLQGGPLFMNHPVLWKLRRKLDIAESTLRISILIGLKLSINQSENRT